MSTDLDKVTPALLVDDASHAARHGLEGDSTERLDLFVHPSHAGEVCKRQGGEGGGGRIRRLSGSSASRGVTSISGGYLATPHKQQTWADYYCRRSIIRESGIGLSGHIATSDVVRVGWLIDDSSIHRRGEHRASQQ